MAGETKVKTIDELPYVTLPMTGNEHIPVYQGNQVKRMHPGDFPAVVEGFVKLDGSTPFQGDQSMNNKRLKDLPAPADDADAARLQDLKDRTGWVKVYPLSTLPETWEANALYLIRAGGIIQAYITDNSGVPANIGGVENVVNKVNNATGAVTVGLSFVGGKLSVVTGSNDEVDLDERYVQLLDFNSPFIIPDHIDIDQSGDATATIEDDVTVYVIDPSALVAAMTRTLPAEPRDYQKVTIKFGGQISSGSVITALTVACGAAHIIAGDAIVGIEAVVGDSLQYQFYNEIWYRI